jgi:hypothetical protein
MTLNSVDE